MPRDSSASAARARTTRAGSISRASDRRQRHASRSPLASSAFTACARTMGSGSAAAPMSALTWARRQRTSGARPPSGVRSPSAATSAERCLALRVGARACRRVPSASCSMNSTALARTSAPCDRSTASRASIGHHRRITRPRAVHRVGKTSMPLAARHHPTTAPSAPPPTRASGRRDTSCTRSARQTPP